MTKYPTRGSSCVYRIAGCLLAVMLLCCHAFGQESPEELVRALDRIDSFKAEQALRKMGAKAVPALIVGLSSDSKRIRAEAAFILASIQDKRAVEPLIGALTDSYYRVRAQAASALGAIGDKRAVPFIVERLKDKDSLVRQTAVKALTDLPDQRAASALSKLISASGDDQIRQLDYNAVQALEKIGSPAIPYLQEAMRRSEDGIRDSSAFAIARIGGPQALAALSTLARAKNPGVRASAVKAMYSLENAPISMLLTASRDKDARVRGAAVLALGAHDSKSSRAAVLDALDDKAASVRYYASLAARDLKDPAFISKLIVVLEDSHSSAATALKEIGKPAVMPLIQSLQSPNAQVRLRAVEVLLEIGDMRAVPALRERLFDDSSKVQQAAAKALKKLTGKEPEHPSIPLTNDSRRLVEIMRWDKRGMARAQLALLGPKVLQLVLPLTRDPEAEIRRDAIWVFGQFETVDAGHVLVNATLDGDGSVREAAAVSLLNWGKTGWPFVFDSLAMSDEWGEMARQIWRRGKWSVPLLAAAMESDLAKTRATATVLMASVKSHHDFSRLLRDSDVRVRFAAATAMANVGDKRAATVLVELLRRRDFEKRFEAAIALAHLHDKSADPYLRSIALDSRIERNRRANALKSIVDKETALAVAIELLEARDIQVKGWAAYYLAELGSKKAVIPLSKSLKKSTDQAVAYALGRIGDVRAVPYLVDALAVAGDFERKVIGEALARIGDPKGVQAAIALLQSDIYYVRRDVATALGAFRRSAAIPQLIVLLRDEDADVRGEAATALGHIGDKRAIGPLRKLLEEESNPESKRATAAALKSLGG